MHNTTGLRLALGHQSRVGKDTFAARIRDTYGCIQLSFAAPIYDITAAIQALLGRPIEKDPALLQAIGTLMKQRYGADIWVTALLQKLANSPSHANIIVSDVRFPNELQALHGAGFTTIKIERPSRPIDRDTGHESETALGTAEFDYTITNNGTLADYLRAIDTLMADIAGPPPSILCADPRGA